MYKIYAEVIRYRLEKEMETKDMIPESQTRFKRRRSTTNNIFTLKYDTKGKKSGRRKKKKNMMLSKSCL